MVQIQYRVRQSTPLDGDRPNSRLRAHRNPLVWISLPVLVFDVSVSALLHPIHVFSVFLIMCILGCPVFYYVAYWSTRGLLNTRVMIPFQSRFQRIILNVMLALLAPGILFLLNAKLDMGPETATTLTVTDKAIHHSRRSSDSYYAIVPSPFPAILSLPGDDTERVPLNGIAQYNALRPGIDQAQIVTRPGFFHMPWIVASRLMPSAPPANGIMR